MEKTIKIEDRDIKLKSNGLNLIIYRSEFGADMLKPQWAFLQNFQSGKGDIGEIDALELARITWTMAKTADKELPDFETWLDSFDNFPLVQIMGDISELIVSNLTSITPIKNETTAEKRKKS